MRWIGSSDSAPRLPVDRDWIQILRSLANIVLPKGSTAEEDYFDECSLLQNRFGDVTDCIVVGSISRFDGFPVHSLAYDHSTSSGIVRTKDDESPLVDEFK